MTEVRIYFEGDPQLRPGFQQFLTKLVATGNRPKLIGCGANVVKSYMDGVKRNPTSINIMLRDSEGPGDRSALLLETRQHDHWDSEIGRNVGDYQLHFMVEIMESWFLADREALNSYYGRGFSENQLPANPNIEQIPKNDVLNRLSAATTNTTKGKYHKTKHAPALLENVDPNKVQAAAPNCAKLFSYIQSLVEQH